MLYIYIKYLYFSYTKSYDNFPRPRKYKCTRV